MENKTFDIVDALNSLRPNSQWSLLGNEYSGLTWLDKEQVKPTTEEIDAEIQKLQAEYDSLEYQRLRKSEYPTIEDQMDLLYHQGYDGWKLVIDSVKNKYPKP